ncbi:BTB/POZ and MATH domain-containing protein 2 [Pseudolycoriella hygida]|uniref:BTB/POZ and MATH domain-containing protein 2 n=1 Tax=Pseudolycoriella hygida TaxID=35572 RepID=A0A9Q0NB37_9DIPT|nr:BTB/POZ and MATH domain-containing protein 2 [Pseudolycoriella hygida]
MDHEVRQFVTLKKIRQGELKSSLHMKIENFHELLNGEAIDSKKITFLEDDSVWWTSIQLADRGTDTFAEFTFHFNASDTVRKAGMYFYFVSGTVNGKQIEPLVNIRITKKESSAKYFAISSSNSLEVQITMTLKRLGITSEKCFMNFDSTVQKKTIISNNKKLLNEEKYSDFTFIVENTRFPVHRNILSAASPIFNEIFAMVSLTNSSEFIIGSTTPTILQHFLNFIYWAELPENLIEVSRQLHQLACRYKIEELENICTSVEFNNLTKENAFNVFVWAEQNHLEKLMDHAWNIIQFEILEVFDSKPVPPSESLSLMLKNKIKKEKLLQSYRMKIRELNTETNTFLNTLIP